MDQQHEPENESEYEEEYEYEYEGSSLLRVRGVLPPLITYVLCLLCIVVFVIQAVEKSGKGVSYPGFVDGPDIWRGEYWGLIVCFFLHGGPMHIIMNVYVMFLMGSQFEPYIGWKRYALFWFLATAFSALAEMCWSGNPGVGASGFGYALFGLMWIASFEDNNVGEMLPPNMAAIFIIWGFICMVGTGLGIMHIANGAHLGGFVFGALCGYVFYIKSSRYSVPIMAAATIIMFVPLFYAPMCSGWVYMKGDDAYKDKRYTDAIFYLDKISNPTFRDAAVSRVLASYLQIGIAEKSFAKAHAYIKSKGLRTFERHYRELYFLASHILTEDYNKSPAEVRLAVDYIDFASRSNADADEDGEAPSLGLRAGAYNIYAWMLATDARESYRNPGEALKYARKACELTEYSLAPFVDTLAAAYASSGDFAKAVEWQTKAIELHTKAGDKSGGDLGYDARLALYKENKPYVNDAPQSGK